MKKAVKKAPTKRYDSDDSKKRLLKAALDTFSSRGYDAATTRLIARKARVNEALIQRYFGGKLGLLLQLIQDFQVTLKKSDPIDWSDDLEADLTRFIRRKIELTKQHKKFLRLAISRAIVDTEVRAELSRYSKDRLPELNTCIKGFMDRHSLKPDFPIEHIGRYLGIVAFSISLLSEIIGTLEPEVAEAIVPVAARMFARGLNPKGSTKG